MRFVWLAALFAGSAAELTFPSVLQASSGVHDLTISAVPFGNYGFNTRGYNGGLPGPTFRMSPGGTLQIRLQNSLTASNSVSCASTDGEFCDVATTNLHTHGLHVSSKGMDDGLSYYSDDIFAEVQPGASADYRFAIPDNHMGGTHWYHPHHHHATALQAGGGAAGVLIVEDPADYLPTEYSSMVEKILFISGHNLQTLQTMAVSSQSTLLTGAVAAADASNLDTNVFFVNGQVQETMSIESGTWYRLRMVYAAVEQSLSLSTAGDATCQMQLLAKDGVYLNTIPRTITAAVLFPGARSDVALTCTCATYPCTATLSSGGRRLQGGRGPARDGNGDPNMGTAAATLLTLSVSQGSATAPELPSFSPTRPCYLADLTGATVPNGQSGELNLQGAGRVVQWGGQGTSMTYDNVHANGGTMADWPALTTFQVGSVYELTVTGVNAHPLHLHVIPFQITAMPADSYNGGYFQVGDWHDTLMISETGGGSQVTVRQQTDVFTGKMVVHCHILEHEDEGMMAYISIAGTEGTLYSDAENLGCACYRNAFTNTFESCTPTPSASSEALGRHLGGIALGAAVMLWIARLL